MKNTAKPGVKEQKMRARIIHKALNLMSKKGIEQVSMREIAQNIGVSKPVLYYYFKNKEELCHSIIQEAVKDYAKNLEFAYQRGLALEELVVMAMKNQMEFFAQNKKIAAFVLHLMSYSFAGKKGGDSFNKSREAKKCEWERVLDREERAGNLPPSSRQDFSIFVSALSSLIMMNSYHNEHKFEEDMPERFIKIIILGLKEYHKGNKK